MNIYKAPVIKYSQNHQDYLTIVLPFHVISNLSKVLVYGKNDYGYQREAIKDHYGKIKKYLVSNATSAILPSAIILGMDSNEMENMLHNDHHGRLELHLDLDRTDKVFRIVDGQHRIKGIEAAVIENPEYSDYLLNVIVLITDKNNRSVELGVFTDINSKGKRIKVDLAELAKHNYELLESRILDLRRHIGIKVGYWLKEGIIDSAWHKGIKFDIHSDIVLGLVGVTAFSESIEGIVEIYLSQKIPPKDAPAHELIEYTEVAAENISKFINHAWVEVRNKWPQCFRKQITQDVDGTIIEIYYDGNYYIQKTLGVKAVNSILDDIVKQSGLEKESLTRFRKVLLESKIKSNDWASGALFSGMNSESGFRKVKNYILNQL